MSRRKTVIFLQTCSLSGLLGTLTPTLRAREIHRDFRADDIRLYRQIYYFLSIQYYLLSKICRVDVGIDPYNESQNHTLCLRRLGSSCPTHRFSIDIVGDGLRAVPRNTHKSPAITYGRRSSSEKNTPFPCNAPFSCPPNQRCFTL